MWSKSQHKTRRLEQAGIREATKQEKLSDGKAIDTLTRLSSVDSDLGNVIVGLEKSDAFQQRLSTINSEIERQLNTEKT